MNLHLILPLTDAKAIDQVNRFATNSTIKIQQETVLQRHIVTMSEKKFNQGQYTAGETKQ